VTSRWRILFINIARSIAARARTARSAAHHLNDLNTARQCAPYHCASSLRQPGVNAAFAVNCTRRRHSNQRQQTLTGQNALLHLRGGGRVTATRPATPLRWLATPASYVGGLDKFDIQASINSMARQHSLLLLARIAAWHVHLLVQNNFGNNAHAATRTAAKLLSRRGRRRGLW